MKHEYVDTETEMRQREVAAEYFMDLTESVKADLSHFCTRVNNLTEDGNLNPSIIVSLANAAAIETDTTAKFAKTTAEILRTSLLPSSDHKISNDLDSTISKTRDLVRSLIESFHGIGDKKISSEAAKHQDAFLQEATTWNLINAVKTFTAFQAALTDLQAALKDCTYALVSQDDKTIKKLFDAASARFCAEHKDDLTAYLQDITSATDAVKDLKSDYRSNAAVNLYIKNPDQPVRVIKRLRDDHATERTLLDLLEYKMKYDALQSIIKDQKHAPKQDKPASPSVTINIDTFNNHPGAVFNDNSRQAELPSSGHKKLPE